MTYDEKSTSYPYRFYVYASVESEAFSSLLRSDVSILRSYLCDERGHPFSKGSDKCLHLLVLGAEHNDDLSSLLNLLGYDDILEIIVLSERDKGQPPRVPVFFQDPLEGLEYCYSSSSSWHTLPSFS